MPLNYIQKQKFDGGGQDQFGTSVAISGDGLTAIVGSPFSVGTKGSAYIFVRSSTDETWSFDTELIANDGQNDDRLGYSVALSYKGDIALIGAIGVDGSSSSYDHGAAYIFTRSNGQWTQKQKLTDPHNYAYDIFGIAVALSADGDTAVIGSNMIIPTIEYGHNLGGKTKEHVNKSLGAFYVYQFDGNTWNLKQSAERVTDNAADTGFGTILALSGDGTKILVGAPREVENKAGKAYSYTYIGGVLTFQQELVAFDRKHDDLFGFSVALSYDGNIALIGAIGVDGNSIDTGAVYFFKRSEVGFFDSITPRLTATDASPYDLFGASIALSKTGETAIIGATNVDVSGNIVEAGAAYVFSLSNNTWTQQQRLLAQDYTPNALFGYSVSISADGGRAIIGAYRKNNYKGSAYTFDLSALKITDIKAINGVVGQPFSFFVATVKNTGAAVIHFLTVSALTPATLPPGLSAFGLLPATIFPGESFNINNVLIGTPTTPGVYPQTFSITDQNNSSDTFAATITIIPAANAGPNQQLISAKSTTLTGNNPTPGTGQWSTVSGPNTPTFSAQTTPTTTVNGLVNGTYVFAWTISSGQTSSTSNVTVTVIAPQAGPDQFFVDPHPTITLAATPVNLPAVGTWSQIAGAAATITNPALPNSTVTGLTIGSYTFRWTVGAAYDDMTVSIIPVANAGADQSVFLTSATLAGNNPFPGKGAWSQVSGPNTAKIAEVHNSTTKISSLNEGVYTLRWTITAGTASSYDDMLLSHISSDDLLVTVQSNNNFVLANTQNTITLTARNNSSSIVFSDVSVYFPLPLGVSLVSQNASIGTYSAGSGFWSIGSIATKTSVSKDLVLKYVLPGTKALTAYVSATPPTTDPNQDNNSSTVLVNVKPVSNVQLVSLTTTPANVLVGSSDVLTATVYNAGPSNVPKATLTLGISNNITSSLGKTFSLGMLPAGGTTTKSTTLTYAQPGVEVISGTVAAGYFSLNTSFFSDLGAPYRITKNIMGPRSVIEVDLNNSGTKLVAVSNENNATVNFYAFTASDGWVQHSTITTGGLFSGPSRLLYAFIDNNYLLGIANYGGQNVLFYKYNNTSQTWEQQTAYTLSLGSTSYPGGLVFDNINGTNLLGVTDFALNAVYFYKPVSGGGWTLQPSMTINTGLSYPYALIYQNFNGLKLLGVTNNTGNNVTFYEAVSGGWIQRTEYTINMLNPTGLVFLPDLNVMGLAHDNPNLVTFYEPNNIGGGFTQDSSPGGVILEGLNTPAGLVYTTIQGESVLGVANVDTNNVAFYTPVLSNIDITPSDNFFITNTNIYPVANAGSDQVLITGSTTTLTANNPIPGTGLWSQISGPSIINFTNPTLPTAPITNLGLGTYIFRWTITGGGITTSDDVTVQVRSANLGIQATASRNLLIPGDANIIILQATNMGPNTISDAVVNFPLPSDVSLIFQLFGRGEFDGSKWDIGPINVSDITTKFLFLRYNLPGIKNLTATISNKSGIGDPLMANNSSTVGITVRNVQLNNVQILPNPVLINSSFNVIFDAVLTNGSNTARATFNWQGSDVTSDFTQGAGLSFTLPTPSVGGNYPLTLSIKDVLFSDYVVKSQNLVFVQIPVEQQIILSNLSIILIFYFGIYLWIMILLWWLYAIENSS